MSGRAIAAIGIILAVLGAPAAAQMPPSGGASPSENDQAKSSPAPPPPVTAPVRPQKPRTEVSPRSGDEFDPPPAAGCPYRGNKLDLLV